MNCQSVIRSLSACQDGELDPARRREVEGHLKGCRACLAEWNGLQELVGRLRLSPPPALDPFFPTRVMSGLRPAAANKFRLLPAAAYALTFVTIFLAVFLLQTSGSGQAPAEPLAAVTYSSVLLEPQELGLLAVHEDTLKLFNGSDHGQK
jgi:anti-sigma factor RsiW